MTLLFLPYFTQPEVSVGPFSAFALGLLPLLLGFLSTALARARPWALRAPALVGAALAPLCWGTAALVDFSPEGETTWFQGGVALAIAVAAYLVLFAYPKWAPETPLWESRVGLLLLAGALAWVYAKDFQFAEPFTLHGFGFMVMLAIMTGLLGVPYRAEKVGLSRELAADLAWWVAVGGLVGAHVLEVLWYHPEDIARDPYILLKVWQSISSFGGMLSGLGVVAYFAWKNPELRAQWAGYVDLVAWCWPLIWVFGRAGCTMAHDHIGTPTDFFLAVDYPRPYQNLPGGPMHNLGFYEMLMFVGVTLLWLWFSRKPRPYGFYLPRMFLLYGVLRWPLDDLRVTDARYTALEWTPGQFGSVFMAVTGLLWVILQHRAWKRRPPAMEHAWHGFPWNPAGRKHDTQESNRGGAKDTEEATEGQ